MARRIHWSSRYGAGVHSLNAAIIMRFVVSFPDTTPVPRTHGCTSTRTRPYPFPRTSTHACRPRPRQWWLRNKKSSLALTKEHRGATTTDLVRRRTRVRARTCTRMTHPQTQPCLCALSAPPRSPSHARTRTLARSHRLAYMPARPHARAHASGARPRLRGAPHQDRQRGSGLAYPDPLTHTGLSYPDPIPGSLLPFA